MPDIPMKNRNSGMTVFLLCQIVLKIAKRQKKAWRNVPSGFRRLNPNSTIKHRYEALECKETGTY
jgi:hypothetical protein